MDLQPSAILLHPLRSPVPMEIVQETNFFRASKGLPPLEPDSRLNQAAMSRAEDMAEKRYFAHNCPHAGLGPEEVALKVGYSYSALAENIAKGSRMNSSEMVDGWIKSKGHRENMLNSRVKEIGFEVAWEKWLDSLGFTPVYYGVQLFGAPKHISQQ